MYGAFGTLAALLQRERTGQGQIVRTSLLAALIGVHAFQGTRATVAGEDPQGAGQPPPLHRALRTVPLPAGPGADQCGQRETVGHVCLGRSESTPPGRNSPRTRTASATGKRSSKKSNRRSPTIDAETAARQTERRRHSGRQGSDTGRGVCMGPGPLPGPGDRRGPQDPGERQPARTAAAVLQRRRHRRENPQGAHARRRCWTRTENRSGSGSVWSLPTRPPPRTVRHRSEGH